MALSLVINGTTYQFPEAGTDPNWGQQVADWATAVTNVLNTLLASGDILETTFSIDNNISVATNVNGLVFDPSTVRAANIDYAIYRTSTTNPAGHVESGTIYLAYDDSGAVGSKWQLGQRVNSGSGVTFSITDAGQVQYTSTDIGSAGYSGKIKFRAKSLSH